MTRNSNKFKEKERVRSIAYSDRREGTIVEIIKNLCGVNFDGTDPGSVKYKHYSDLVLIDKNQRSIK